MSRTQLLLLAACTVIAFALSCSANSTDSTFTPGGTGGGAGGEGMGGAAGVINTAGTGATGQGGAIPIDSGPSDPNVGCAESAKKIYLVTKENDLYSLNPEVDGMAGYVKINQLGCDSTSTPQSMAVDRSGKAYVFYSSGELFLVDTTNAQCSPLSGYQHPVGCSMSSCVLGMGFTADAPNSTGQTLYIQSPDFGFATVDIASLAVDKKNVFDGVLAELTGGIDAKLFRFESAGSELVEVTQGTWETTSIHTFDLTDVGAFAFSRYAGKFYMFTASNGAILQKPTKTTVYDPVANTETTRDANLGFTVVGAGQSTCVPPPPVK